MQRSPEWQAGSGQTGGEMEQEAGKAGRARVTDPPGQGNSGLFQRHGKATKNNDHCWLRFGNI